MRPTELNALLTLLTNYLYTSLDEQDFTNLGIFLSLLSREMLAMEAIRGLCRLEKEEEAKKD
jgi:hypothetical protein